jgi:hypothetical protein
MGREVRMVASNWQHPIEWGKDSKTGKPCLQFRPLFGGSWSERAAEWDEANAQWERGYEKDHTKDDSQWKPKEADRPKTFEEWDGARPKQKDYMPEWGPGEATYLMMYDDTSEVTPRRQAHRRLSPSGPPTPPPQVTPTRQAARYPKNGAPVRASTTNPKPLLVGWFGAIIPGWWIAAIMLGLLLWGLIFWWAMS